MSTEFLNHLTSSERNRKKKKNFPEYWTTRKYTEEAAYDLAFKFFNNTISDVELKMISCSTQFNKDFWLIRGYSLEYALKKVSDIQSNNAKKYAEKYTKEERKKFTTTCIEYYLEQGMSLEDAQEAVSNRQRTFSLQKCVDRYGKEKGYDIWKNRQYRWQETMKNKSTEELKLIYSKKGITLENQIAKYGVDEGTNRYEAWAVDYRRRLVRNGFPGYSLESLDWFASFIPKDILNDAKIGTDEFFIYDNNKIYFYDFKYKNIIIEYHGHMYHYNPKINDDNWHSPFGLTKEESLQKDLIKKTIALSNGFNFFEFYSNDSKEYEAMIKTEILNSLYEENNNKIIQST